MSQLPLPPNGEKMIDSLDKPTQNWQKWFNLVQQTSSGASLYGNLSALLNSDFNFQRGIATPVTQADGNGAYIAEKWQIYGASSATYTITSTTYAAADANTSGSTTYEHMVVSGFNGDDLYFYQRFSGAQFLRQFQQNAISFMAQIKNNGNQVKVKFAVVQHFDPSETVTMSGLSTINTGVNTVTSSVNLNAITNKTIGAGAYLEFRMYFAYMTENAADIDIQLIKAELGSASTPFYIDHALEKARIDNS